MKKRTFLICLLVSVGLAWLPTSVGQVKEDNSDHLAWQMLLVLDTPNLVPPAVQYAVFDKDPIPGFRANLKRMKPYHAKQLERDKSEADRKLSRSTYLSVNWDNSFKEVTGDQVYLLTAAPGVRHSISSNSQDGKKWVVTKIVRIKGEPVCWCLPVETKTGERIKVKFTEVNAFDLDSVYEDTMRSSIPSK